MTKDDYISALIAQHKAKWGKVSEKTYKWIEKMISLLENPKYAHLHFRNFTTFEEYEEVRKKHNREQAKRKREIKRENEWFDRLLWEAKWFAHKQMSERSYSLWEKFREQESLF